MLLIFSKGFMDFINFNMHLSLHASRPLLHLATPSLASLLLFFAVSYDIVTSWSTFALSSTTTFFSLFISSTKSTLMTTSLCFLLTSSHLIVTADCRFLLIFTTTGPSLLNIHTDFSSATSLRTSNFH